jgi:hypothetical protein
MAEDTTASAAPDATSTEPTATGAASEAKDPATELADLQKEHAALLDQHKHLRGVLGRQGQELGTLRTRAAAEAQPGRSEPGVGARAIDYGEATEAAAAAATQGEGNEVRLSLIEFKQSHPDLSQKRFEDIILLLNDDTRCYDFAVPKRDGSGIDYRKTLERAHEHFEVTELRAVQAASKERADELPQKKASEIARATASGTAASGGGTTYSEDDIASMTSQEMIDNGLITVDPGDPIVRRGPVRQG